MASSSKNKFRLENNVFVSATEEINASELQAYMFNLVKEGLLPSGTTFYMIGGIHHGTTIDGKVIEGQTDFTLLHGFYHQVYNNLTQLEVWDKMNYDYVLVPITCSAKVDHTTWTESYALSNISRRELSRLARKLRKGKKPSLVIFASCFSYNSNIKDYLFSKGAMASLSISHDKGKVTEGKLFALYEDQQNVVKEFAEVKKD